MELVDPPLGIDKLGKAGKERMGIRGDTDRDQTVFHAVDHFLLFGSLGRAAYESFAGGHVNEDNRIVFRVKVLFHKKLELPPRYRRGGDAEDTERMRAVKQASQNFFATKLLKINCCL